jgi:hypothetical protein
METDIGPISSLVIALALGVAGGIIFRFATADSRFKAVRDCALGVIGALIGWGFVMLLPILQHKYIGADFVALGTTGVFLHFYWAVFKERTNLMKDFDSNAPNNPFTDEERPELR